MAETTTMIFRVEPELKASFEAMAKDLDLTASQLMRQMMRGAVEQHGRQTAQKQLPLPTPAPTQTNAQQKKPKKGQRLASAKPANWRPQ